MYKNVSFSINRRNVHETKYDDLSTCRFDFNEDLFCPIFSVGTIIEMLENKASFEDLAVRVSELCVCMCDVPILLLIIT